MVPSIVLVVELCNFKKYVYSVAFAELKYFTLPSIQTASKAFAFLCIFLKVVAGWASRTISYSCTPALGLGYLFDPFSPSPLLFLLIPPPLPRLTGRQRLHRPQRVGHHAALPGRAHDGGGDHRNHRGGRQGQGRGHRLRGVLHHDGGHRTCLTRSFSSTSFHHLLLKQGCQASES